VRHAYLFVLPAAKDSIPKLFSTGAAKYVRCPREQWLTLGQLCIEKRLAGNAVLEAFKLRALLQRRENRDMFDLHHGLEQLEIDDDKLLPSKTC
jgi:hypothetical protein